MILKTITKQSYVIPRGIWGYCSVNYKQKNVNKGGAKKLVYCLKEPRKFPLT